MWSNKYIGIPYKAKGRDYSGIDCWGLVRLIYMEQYSISLPSLSDSFIESDNERIAELINLYKEGWEETTVPSEGDVILFRVFGENTHMGVVINEKQFIHSIQNKAVAVENIDSVNWSKRIAGFYKYREAQTNAVMNVAPHPLKTQRYTVPVPPGTTLAQLSDWIAKEYAVSDSIKSETTILLNGKVVSSIHWPTTIIKDSDVLEYRVVPKGGDGFRLFLMLALVMALPQLSAMVQVGALGALGGTAAGTWMATTAAGAAFLAGASNAAVMLAGMALINVIAPVRPPQQKTPDEPGKIYLATGSQNRMGPYESIPVVLGKVRMTPPLGAQSISRYQNETDTYLDMLLIWGYGPLDVDESTLKVGDVPLENYLDVNGNYSWRQETINHKNTPTQSEIDNFNNIYGRDIKQEIVNIALTCEGSPEATVAPGPWVNTAINLTEENPLPRVMELAIAFPQGLRRIKSKGSGSGEDYNAPITFELQYKYSGTSWLALPELKLGGQAQVDTTVNQTYYDENGQYVQSYTTKTLGTDSIKKDGFVWYNTYSTLPLTGTVEIRIRRLTGDDTTPEGSDFQWVHAASFQTAKIITNVRPATDPPGCKIAKTAITIKATDQLNGNVEGLNAIVQTWCLSWNGSSWVTRATNNPADLFRYILTHPANPRRITEGEVNSKIDLQQLQYWAAYCNTKGFTFNSVEGGGRSVMEILRDICAAGRASPALVDGRWTVVIDEPKSTIVQHFSPHNSWGFEGQKSIPNLPDAFRINYIDEDQGYQQAETIVPFPGKTLAASQLFETIDLPGVTKKSLVTDHARWHIAQIKLRPEVYTLNTDIEYIVCNRGDRVKVTHDVPLWGNGSGRIKTIVVPGQVYDLDEQIFIDPQKDYVLRVRGKSGSSTVKTVNTQFSVVQAEKDAEGLKLIINESHSVLPGDLINVSGPYSQINGTNLVVLDTTSNVITCEKVGDYFTLSNFTGTVTLTASNYKRVKFSQNSTTAQVDAGDLFLFGELDQESQDLIVLSIEPTDNKSARLTLTDYGVVDNSPDPANNYNIFNDYLTLSPSTVFETQITLPPTNQRNLYKPSEVPIVLQIYSGKPTLNRLSPGTYSYNINVTYTNIDDISVKTKYVECQYDLSGSVSSSSSRSITVPFNQGSITIPDVRENRNYKIRLRYVTEDGVGGPWTVWYTHLALGLIDEDNLPLAINVDRVTRYLEITPYIDTGDYIPQDFKGFEFRVYKNSGDPTQNFWDVPVTDPNMQVLFGNSPVRFNLRDFSQPRLSLSGVQYRIACRVVDVTGRYISTPALASVLITSLI